MRFCGGTRCWPSIAVGVEQGTSSFWCFCVDYLDHRTGSKENGPPAGTRNKIDYKEVLGADEFAVFARLRDLRKGVAQREAVPVYTIFTNEQLAKMVQARAATKSDLEIAGVGDARFRGTRKNSSKFCREWNSTDETSRKPV